MMHVRPETPPTVTLRGRLDDLRAFLLAQREAEARTCGFATDGLAEFDRHVATVDAATEALPKP